MKNSKEIEKTIITIYRKDIYRKFRKAIEDYELVKSGDKIAVCISGGKDSMLMAKCFQELKRHGNISFEMEFLVMDPGYSQKNKEKIIENAKLLDIPIKIYDSNIFNIVNSSSGKSPCFLCAKMRRGFLYEKAEELGCNKIALGHHFDDAIETLLINIFYGGEIKTMMPKLWSDNFNLELIRPMFYVKEADIISWARYNNLEFLDCACKVTKKDSQQDENISKRKEIKNLIKEFRKKSKYVDLSIFHSMSNVNLDALIAWKTIDKKKISFLDVYDEKRRYKKSIK